MNRFDLINKNSGLRDIGNLPNDQLRITPLSGSDSTLLPSHDNVIPGSMTSNYDELSGILRLTISWFWEDPIIQGKPQFKFKYLYVHKLIKGELTDLAKISLSNEMVISDCRKYHLTLLIRDNYEIEYQRLIIRDIEDPVISEELVDHDFDLSDISSHRVWSAEIQRDLLMNTKEHVSVFNNMVELQRYGDGHLISGERILDKDFNSYKYVPYPITIKIEEGDLRYDEREGLIYNYIREGNVIYFQWKPIGLREVVFPVIPRRTVYNRLGLPLTTKYELHSSDEPYIFCGSYFIQGHKNEYLTTLNGKEKIAEGYKCLDNKTGPIVVADRPSGDLLSLFMNLEDRNRFSHYDVRLLTPSSEIVDISHDIILLKNPDIMISKFGVMRGVPQLVTLSHNIYKSDKFRMTYSGMEVDMKILRRNFIEPKKTVEDPVILGRSLYQKIDKTYKLI